MWAFDSNTADRRRPLRADDVLCSLLLGSQGYNEVTRGGYKSLYLFA